MLIGSLRRRPRDAAWLAAWSAVQALPAAASGWVLAEAAGMFLAGRTAQAIGWLGLLAAAAAAGAFGTRQANLRRCRCGFEHRSADGCLALQVS